MTVVLRSRISAGSCSCATDTFCGWEISFPSELHEHVRFLFEKHWKELNETFRLAIVWPKRGQLIIVTDYPQSLSEREEALNCIKALLGVVDSLSISE
jgi:hypothetical protein